MSQNYFTSTQYAIYSVINNNNSYEGVIDRNLNIILQPIYSDVTMKNIEIGDYYEDYFIVERNGKRAVLDKEGNIKIDYCDSSVYDLWNEYEKIVKNSLNNN